MRRPGELQKPVQTGPLRKDGCKHTVAHFSQSTGGWVCANCGATVSIVPRGDDGPHK